MKLRKGIGAIGQIIDLAGKSPEAKQAGVELGKTALILTKTINTALLPLVAINSCYDKARAYFSKYFTDDIVAVASDIPSECVVEPKSSVVGPAMQGLAFVHDEPDLKEMFLGLLKTSMDGRVEVAPGNRTE